LFRNDRLDSEEAHYGLTDKQRLRLKRTITGGTFVISMNEHTAKHLPVEASAFELNKCLKVCLMWVTWGCQKSLKRISLCRYWILDRQFASTSPGRQSCCRRFWHWNRRVLRTCQG
jgi:hypothetical protein